MIDRTEAKGSLIRISNKTKPDTWFLRFREIANGRRVYRKVRIGSVRDLPHRRDAERAVCSLRQGILSGNRPPSTVRELAAHYNRLELTPERKSFASIQNHLTLFKLYIEPKWGALPLDGIRTVQVEEWLSSLPLAPGSRTKIKSVFSVLYSHAIRHEFVTFNPISKVRTSAKRVREKDVLTPHEFQALLPQLSLRDRAMVMLAGSTGLRRSELIALTWADVDSASMEVRVVRSCFRNRFGAPKTEFSNRPVPLHPAVLATLNAWREKSPYPADTDFLFPSNRKHGKQPLSPDSLLTKAIRPALVRAGLKGKRIGWHNFRHSLATNLRSMGVDVKIAQELLRHANSRTTLDIYTRAVSQQKRDASALVTDLLIPGAYALNAAPSTCTLSGL